MMLFAVVGPVAAVARAMRHSGMERFDKPENW
jgi:hypothetical protein